MDQISLVPISCGSALDAPPLAAWVRCRCFTGAKFFGFITNFAKVQFLEDAKFDRSQFKGNTSFYESNFNKDAYFYRSVFNNLDFRQTKFNGDSFFKDSKVNGVLNLDKAEYSRFYIRFNNINELAYDETAYKTLIDNFKKLGYFSDAYNCYYHFMKAYANENLLGFKIIRLLYEKMIKIFNSIRVNLLATVINNIFISIYYLFAWLFYGFGTKPEFALLWSILLITIFGFFWYRIGAKNTKKDIDDEYNWNRYWSEHKEESELKINIMAMLDPFLLSAAIFLSGTKFFIDPPTIPESFDRSNAWVNRAYSLERFLGGVFLLLLIVSIGSIVLTM